MKLDEVPGGSIYVDTNMELAKRFTVMCLPEDTYAVPAAALALLDELQLSYCLLETVGFDRAVRALRNSLAS
jgi:hypothetical protein